MRCEITTITTGVGGWTGGGEGFGRGGVGVGWTGGGEGAQDVCVVSNMHVYVVHTYTT